MLWALKISFPRIAAWIAGPWWAVMVRMSLIRSGQSCFYEPTNGREKSRISILETNAGIFVERWCSAIKNRPRHVKIVTNRNFFQLLSVTDCHQHLHAHTQDFLIMIFAILKIYNAQDISRNKYGPFVFCVGNNILSVLDTISSLLIKTMCPFGLKNSSRIINLWPSTKFYFPDYKKFKSFWNGLSNLFLLNGQISLNFNSRPATWFS